MTMVTMTVAMMMAMMVMMTRSQHKCCNDMSRTKNHKTANNLEASFVSLA